MLTPLPSGYGPWLGLSAKPELHFSNQKTIRHAASNRRWRFVCVSSRTWRLLDLRFLELDVLAYDRVILFENDLFSRRAGVLLRDIEETCAGGRQQFDLLGGRLSHSASASE